MSGLIKYRVHEVAKDFGMTSKEITQILTDYATTPKNHMQVLEDDELNDIFEYLTQHHQAASLEELYKVPDQPKAKPQAAPAAQGAAPKGEAAPAKQPQQATQPQQQHKHVRIASALDCCSKRDEATIVETKNLQHECCEELRD